MAYIITNTGNSYANFAAAFNALPATFDANYTITADAGETTTSTPFTLTGKTTGSYTLTIDFQDKTRELYNSSTSANYVVSIGISNVIFKNVTFKGANYTGTSCRTVYLSTNITNVKFQNCKFTDGYNALGHYSITGTQQIDGITLEDCYFTNYTNTSLNLGTKTFSAGGYLTALDSDYQLKNIVIRRCKFEDTASKGNVGTSTVKADLGIKVYSCLGLTLEDNTVNGVGGAALDVRHSKNVINKRFNATDYAFNSLTTRQCIYYSNILNLETSNSLIYTSTSSYFHLHYDTCKSIKSNHNTIYISSSGGDVVNFNLCLDIQEHVGNLYYSAASKYTFSNTTAGLTISEIGVWDYNYYGFAGNIKVCDLSIGSSSYAIRHVGYSGTTSWLSTGKDANSYFVASGSTTAEKAEILNKNTNTNKPYYSVLTSSGLYNKISGTKYGGSQDVRGWNKVGNYDIGAYDYDAIDPNAPTNPPTVTVTKDRNDGIKNFSTFSFTASAVPHDGATISSYSWSFGDGTTSTSQNTNKIFSASGILNATVTVTDSNGLQGTGVLSVNIVDDGVEVNGGPLNNNIYTGSTAVQSAINAVFAGGALTSSVDIKIYSSVVQSQVYYSGTKEVGEYQFQIIGYTKNGSKPIIDGGANQNGLWLQVGRNVNVHNVILKGGTSSAPVRAGTIDSMYFYNCDFAGGLYSLWIADCDGLTFENCKFLDGNNYRLNMSSCRNIVFKKCLFDTTLYPNNEFTLSPSVMASCFNNFNITFISTEFNGRGNWSTGFKGSGNEDWIFKGCKFKHFIGRLFWFTGSDRDTGAYNAKRFKFKRCIFDEANLADPSFFASDFGTKANEASIMFDMDYCYDFEFLNNTFIQDRRGKSTYSGSIFYGTYNTNNIKIKGNIFALLDTGTATSNVYQVYNMGLNSETTEKVVYSQDNVYIFASTDTALMKYGKIGTNTYSTAAAAHLNQANLENNVYEVRGSNTIIDVTTFELNSGTSPLPSAATQQTTYDYDGNTSVINLGAKEYSKTQYPESSVISSMQVLGINRNPVLTTPIYYSGTNNTVPSLDKLNFYLNDDVLDKASQVLWYTILIDGSTENKITARRNGGFNYNFPYTLTNLTYVVRAAVYFNSGIVTYNSNFTVTKPRPISEFSLSEYQIFKGGSIDFYNESQYGNTYLWNITKYGGSTETFTTPTISEKVFNDAGYYDVSLSATNEVDTSTVTYKKTIQVLDDLTQPYIKISTLKNTYYRNERIKINSLIKFHQRFYRYLWLFYDSENVTNTPVFVHRKKNADFDASKLPKGVYDVMYIASSPSGDVVKFHRRLITVYNNPLSVFNKNCTITDTYTRKGGTVVRIGTRIDGTADNITPGTQIRLTGESRGLYLSDIKGTADNPVTIVPNNVGSRFNIASVNETAIFMSGCEHVKILGQQNPNNDKYGFNIYGYTTEGVSNACVYAFRAMELSTYISMSGCELHNTTFAGIQCKTEPSASDYKTFRGYASMDWTYIHDNYLHDVDGEGMYMGFTSWGNSNNYYGAPTVPDENGNTLAKLFAQFMINTKIYRNKIKNTGWDGIQVSNGVIGTEIHDNECINLGTQEIFGQNSGMAINTGFDGLIYNNRMNKAVTAFPYKRLWAFNNVFVGGGFYMITDNEDYWDEELPRTTGPYYGQYDNARIFNNNKGDVRIFGNTFYTSGKLLTHNNKCNGGGTFKKFIVSHNFILSKKNSYYQIDPTVVPLSPTTGNQVDTKLLQIFDNGIAQETTTHYVLKGNSIRADDNFDDCKIVNIGKVQAMISPESVLNQSVTFNDFILDITMDFWHGLIFDINGYAKGSLGGTSLTAGAYTFPNYLMTSGNYLLDYISISKSEKVYADANILPDRTLLINVDDKVIHVHNGIKPGGFKTIKEETGATGTFMIGTNTYHVTNGFITSIT